MKKLVNTTRSKKKVKLGKQNEFITGHRKSLNFEQID